MRVCQFGLKNHLEFGMVGNLFVPNLRIDSDERHNKSYAGRPEKTETPRSSPPLPGDKEANIYIVLLKKKSYSGKKRIFSQ